MHSLYDKVIKMGKTLDPNYWNAKLVNLVVGLIGVVSILAGIILGMDKTISVILVSIGTSMLASAIVTWLSSRYLMTQNRMMVMVERWGLGGIYKQRAEINAFTNKALKRANSLDICAMGLKGFRDAQGKAITQRVTAGMSLRVLTINPNSDVLSEKDKTEGLSVGSTKATIESLIVWISELKSYQTYDGQVELKMYNHYPHDFYFNIDGTVFTGPYQAKTSQQTITYRFNRNAAGARYFVEYFEELWSNTV